MVEQAKLKLDLVGKPVDHTDYRSMIESLMYVTSSIPDIMFATCMCARYKANPNEHHVSAIKRIFCYLKGTINLGLWYPKDSGFDLTAYSHADHAGCHLDRKSTSGSVQFLGDKLVCSSSKKQNCVSISTTESKYIAVSGCCAQVLWMRTQLMDYGFFYDKVSIYCDSKSAIAISCNPVDIVGYVYPVDFVILDIKEDRNKPFILEIPFLTMAKAVIRFEKDTITQKSGKNKIDFVKVPALPSEMEKNFEDDLDLITPTNTVIFHKKKL
nr:uncharacterized mitochondrial protein AtMg00810-like [Tanacetum cinerariifolium]